MVTSQPLSQQEYLTNHENKQTASPSSALILLITALSCQTQPQGRPTAFPTEAPTLDRRADRYRHTNACPDLDNDANTHHDANANPGADRHPPDLYRHAHSNPPGAVAPPLNSNTGVVDWSYFYLTEKENEEDGSLVALSAMVAFQLMDRGIHTETINILGDDVTVFTSGFAMTLIKHG